MNSKIYELSKKLNLSLLNDQRVKNLAMLEEELDNSYEVYVLSQKKDEALNNYLNIKEIYLNDNEQTKDALAKLVKAKEDLSHQTLVKKYLSIYNEVRDLYMEIDQILFSDFKVRHC